jgi:hypothetical protein
VNDTRHLAERDGIATGRLGLAPDQELLLVKSSARRRLPALTAEHTSEDPVFGTGRVSLDQKGRNKHG